MDVEVGAVDLRADAGQARQDRHADPDGGDRVAVALEHAHAAPAQRDDRGGEEDESDDHPLRLLARQHGIDAVDHHDPDAREHGGEREQVGIGVRQRKADHQMRGQAQPEEQRPVGQGDRRGVVQRQIRFGPGRDVFGLDEDRGEAGDHQQRRGHEAQELAISGAQHSRERTVRCGAGTPHRSLPYGERARRRGVGARLDPVMSCRPVTSHG